MGSLDVIPLLRITDIQGVASETGDSVSLFNYLPDEAIVVLWAPLEIAEKAKELPGSLAGAEGDLSAGGHSAAGLPSSPVWN